MNQVKLIWFEDYSSSVLKDYSSSYSRTTQVVSVYRVKLILFEDYSSRYSRTTQVVSVCRVKLILFEDYSNS